MFPTYVIPQFLLTSTFQSLNPLIIKSPPQNYWSLIKHRFMQNRSAKWAYRALLFLMLVAIFNPFIAGDVPIYVKLDGKSSFPILKKYLIDLGLADTDARYRSENYWHETKFEAKILPIIPYSSTYQDTKNTQFKSPFGPQNLGRRQARHYLGTDQLGRDVAAGMVSGVQTALMVGLFSMLLASLIGIFWGALAGYFGDDKLQVSLIRLVLNMIAFAAGLHVAFIARSYPLSEGNSGWELIKSLGIFLSVFMVINFLAGKLEKRLTFQKKITVPIDLIVMRIVEVMNSIPGLLLILAIAAIFQSRSLWTIIFIIGLIRWTSITRFIRAELLKIRNLEYIQAARAMGFSHWRILLKHAIPNALGPVLITIAFGIAGAILLEAALSFLGLGVSITEVTWGSLLRIAREQQQAWWLAIFPGLAIFATVMIFNLIGEGLKDAIDAKDL